MNKAKLRFDPRETIAWLRTADRALLLQGWQDTAFLNPVNVIFFYMMVRDSLDAGAATRTVYELQCTVMACLYLAFSYMGNEISYPLKPFLVEANRDLFWQRTIALMSQLSGNMLRVNQEPRFFTELFYELKSYGPHEDPRSGVYATKSLHSTSAMSLSELSQKSVQKPKESVTSTFSKPINVNSQLVIDKIGKQHRPDPLYEAKEVPGLPKLNMVARPKPKAECFNFLTKNEQFVMYGSGAGDEQNLTYCI